MAIEFKLPELGEGIESGDVLSLLVKEGDVLRANQAVMELETDKATVEVPCPHAGRISKLHVAEGQTLKVGASILTLDSAASTDADAPTPKAAAPALPKTAAPAPPPGQKQSMTPPTSAADSPSSAPRAAPPVRTAAAAPAAPANDVDADDESVAPAGPATRRFARELGVDLSRVQGSGPAGRITREDVVNVVRQLGVGHSDQSAAAPAQRVTKAPASNPQPPAPSLQSPTPASDVPTTAPGEPDTDAWGPIRREIASRVRRTIAAKMHESWSTIPRVTNFDDADITELELKREESKEDYAKTGVKLTTMPFLMKAVAVCLRKHPLVNAAYDHEHGVIVYKDYVNLGIAVDTERGLVVPVVRNADRLTIPEMARQLIHAVQSVRSNSFSVEDLRGGTFTISNLGSVGGTYSTPIINFPEVAILLAGRARKLPVIVDDDLAIRLMLPLSLSYDHRLVDGATAARFLNDVIGYLQSPTRLLLSP